MRAVLAVLAALVPGAACSQPAAVREQPVDRIEAPLNYDRMRDMMLDLTPEDLNLPGVRENEVFGVVMEMDVDGETATVIGLMTGDASIYLSSGGGVIGGFAHPSVQDAARSLVNAGEAIRAELESAAARPRPGPGEVRFYLLTHSGLLTAVAPAEGLLNESHPLFRLFLAGNSLLTELRMIASAP